MEKKQQEYEELGSKKAVDVALAILKYLLEHTPVDTSRAISNWQTALHPISAAISAHVQGIKGSSRAASIAVAYDQAVRLLANKKPGEEIFLSNLLKYIGRLNDGYSKQAPAGFVEASILVGRLVLKDKNV